MITAPRGARSTVTTGVVVLAVSMLVVGFWAWLAPHSFAGFAGYPVHFLHDPGVFQIGIGAGLLAALVYRDAVTVSLAGFLIANSLHAINHAVDLDLGGHPSDALVLGALSLVAGAALYLRGWQHHYAGTARAARARGPHH